MKYGMPSYNADNIKSKTKPPCCGCEKRYPACHDKCEDYISWRNDDFNDRFNKAKFLRDNDRSHNSITNKNIKAACETSSRYKYAINKARYGSSAKAFKA